MAEKDSDGESAVYYFDVKDKGIGVAPENQKKIFRVFEQIGASISKSSGTGLGLPIRMLGKGVKAGMNGFIPKPVNLMYLCEVLEKKISD